MSDGATRQPADGRVIPRYAGASTYARLPRLDQVERCDVAVVGVPFDSGTTYRPGARFGPTAIRQGSRLLRPYHPDMDTMPFALQQVADAGDIACNPFDIQEAIGQIQHDADELLFRCDNVIALGGDHSLAAGSVSINAPIFRLNFVITAVRDSKTSFVVLGRRLVLGRAVAVLQRWSQDGTLDEAFGDKGLLTVEVAGTPLRTPISASRW